MNQREVFKKTLDWLQDRIDKGILNSTSSDLIEEAQGTLRNEISQYFKGIRNERGIYNYINKGYTHFLKNTQLNHKGITKQSLNDLKPKFRKELENKVQISFNLMKNQENEIKQKLASRFINYVTIDSKEVRGNGASKKSLLEFLDFAKENGIAENHAKFILQDQTRKLTASLDDIIAKENGAIGAIWHNRGDKRVTGYPNGINKPTQAHGDHWEREGVFYVFKDSWGYKKGYIDAPVYENLEDGGVGKAIGCRCWLQYIYDLRDVPYANLTKKGKELLDD